MKKEGDKPIQIIYKSIGKKRDFLKEVLDSIPKPLRPTQKTGWICLGLLLIITIWGVIQAMMPITDLSFDLNSEKTFELKIEVGLPMVFFGTTDNGTNIKFNILALIVDTLLYLLLGYIIDILINLMLTIKLTETEEERRRKPKEFLFKQSATGEKVGNKIIEKASEKNSQENQKTTNPPQKAKQSKTKQETPKKQANQTQKNNTEIPKATKIVENKPNTTKK